MNGKAQRIPYSKDLKRKGLTSGVLYQMVEMERQELEQTRMNSRKSNAQVQMSVRMEEGEYLRFRALCKSQRRTNGGMLVNLLEFFLAKGANHLDPEPAASVSGTVT